MKQRIIWGIVLIFMVIFFIGLGLYFYFGYKLNDNNINIFYSDYFNENFLYTVNIEYEGNNEGLFCSVDNKNWIEINKCKFELNKGNYNLYLKNKYFDIKKNFEIKQNISGEFSSSLDNVSKYFLALGGEKKVVFVFDYPIDFVSKVYWRVDDPNIVEVKNNVIYGKNVGTTNVNATLKDGNKKTYTIEVTDLIIPATYNNKKSYLPCKRYTDEENKLLDEILASRVEEAGVGTRGGVIAAARFLTLEFPYSIRYFNENGRLVDHGYRLHIDGEGRYYHKGLYLSEYKYKELEDGASTKSGPKMWGCNLYDSFISKYNMNGFTCSGFVTWAMFNGGFDVGDVGAGNFVEFNDDLSDLGEHKKITNDYMKNGNYKVGDFIGRNGHAALIIGIDDQNIYTAEALPPKLMLYTYERYSGIVTDPNLTYIIEMSNIYPNGEGIYTNMWE